MKYSNPVLSGFYPDPSMTRVGDKFYLVTSTFEYFPGVPIFESDDLVNWEQIGHCLTRESQLPLKNAGSSGGIYAPTIRYHNGRFYMITTNVSHGQNFYVWTDDPRGEWSEPIWLDGWPGIDPSLFFDEDGKVYLTGNSGHDETPGIYQAEIDIETGKIISDRKFLWSGTGGAYPEGPHLYKMNGWYYLLISEGGTEYAHMLTIARSNTPYGPFESYEKNPILTHRSKNSPIQATGHADFVQHPDGSWWTVFLGIRPIGYSPKHHLGRETFLAPVTWTEDGWPVVGNNGMADVEMEANHLTTEKIEPAVQTDDFDNAHLDYKWMFLRNPYEGSWSLTDRPGWLKLNGSSITLNDVDSPAFIGRRQQHFDCHVTTLLEFSPQQDGEEAGLTTLMNERYHYEIALTKENGVQQLILRKRVSDIFSVVNKVEYSGDLVILGINADKETYTFTFENPDSQEGPQVIGTGECGFLSKEVAGGFTGVCFGLYTTGNGKASTTPAYFDWFKYEINK